MTRTVAPETPSIGVRDVRRTGDVRGVLGVGIDLVDVARVERELRRDAGFADAVLRPAEAKHCRALVRPALCIAARFAAKEAALKALGTGRAGAIGWHDIEIVHNENGQPNLVLSGETRRTAEHLGVRRIHVSLTHDGGNAAAVVVLEG